jgi:hypothetical protein
MRYQFFIGLFIISLATCSNEPKPTNSGIEGQVFIGPMCAVVQEGQACADQPYQATLTVISLEGGGIVRVQTDEAGRFKIPLAPGGYLLRPESPNAMPYAAEQTLIVEAGKFTQVSVMYDSGIR